MSQQLLLFQQFQGIAFFDTKITWQFLTVCWLLLVISIGGVRLSMRVFREFFADSSVMENAKPTLIVGAGAAGTLLVRQNAYASSNAYGSNCLCR